MNKNKERVSDSNMVSVKASIRSPTTGFLFAIVGTLLFALKSIFIKFLYQEGLDANTVLVLRMFVALPFYCVILIFLLTKPVNRDLLNKSILPLVFLLGFLGYYLASFLDLKGLELITAQLERLSLFTYPFMVLLIGFIWLKEEITWKLMLALVITYSGLCLVMMQELRLTGNNTLLGVSFVLGSALCFALYVLFSKPLIKKLNSLLFTCFAMIASIFFSLLHGMLILDVADVTVSYVAWFWILMLVVFSTVIPSFLITEAINKIGPVKTSIVGMLGPVFTIALAVYLLNEPFTKLIALGIVLVLLGVYILTFVKIKQS